MLTVFAMGFTSKIAPALAQTPPEYLNSYSPIINTPLNGPTLAFATPVNALPIHHHEQ